MRIGCETFVVAQPKHFEYLEFYSHLQFNVLEYAFDITNRNPPNMEWYTFVCGIDSPLRMIMIVNYNTVILESCDMSDEYVIIDHSIKGRHSVDN